MSKRKNMYKLSVCSWQPFVGCGFNCVYCTKSFKAQVKRQKQNCQKCYDYIPHEHPERLEQPLPKTGYMEFIFVCPFSDISFCETEYLQKIVDRIRKEKDKTFLVHSKDPLIFNTVFWPDNVILGTTIETDVAYDNLSSAPTPLIRYSDFLTVEHSRKMVIIEPVVEFNLEILLFWIVQIKPVMVWLGYDTNKNNLPEPPLSEVKRLHWELSKLGIPVLLKHL